MHGSRKSELILSLLPKQKLKNTAKITRYKTEYISLATKKLTGAMSLFKILSDL